MNALHHMVATLLGAAALFACDESPPRCYSPLHPPESSSPNNDGCACASGEGEGRAHCIDRQALVCAESRWLAVFDGPCEPQVRVPPDWCSRLSGTLGGDSCPTGFDSRYGVVLPATSVDSSAGDVAPSDAGTQLAPPAPDAGYTRAACCIPLQVSVEECRQAGYRAVAATNAGDVLATRCSDGATLRGFIAGSDQLCCD